ncbi:3-oxoacyl-ACP synthase [Nocardia sp. SYP-A9097]|uniref:3-oxoacyl-ACP synthase III family protein n=1 Tax=Nocardia sp. SYP-A9097 TaxID=2663237 RepID=UPI00129AEACE|nr:3-oxoacyl-ACP synthase III family protein [Nocardia sp. SYP-A9097]MRH92352.1 3-oxoacyl-ACP synthase [Nocardia sp. SYP-A9097]
MTERNVHILSVGTFLPGDPIDNVTLAERFGMNSAWLQWVDMFIGTKGRHYGFDIRTGERHTTVADMGTASGARALRQAALAPEDIDLIVMGTATPDQLMPATVNVIADRLGINGIASFQLQSGCSGALQALDVARQMLLTGRHRTALVIGAESIGKHYDADVGFASADAAYAVNTLLFGDGAGAAVLSTDPVAGTPVLHGSMVRLVGMGRSPGQVVEWYGAGGSADGRGGAAAVSEDYKAIEQSVPVMAKEMLKELLEDLDWNENEIDFILPPQLSGRMTKLIVDHLALSDSHEISCVREIGNTGNATPFFQLERVIPKMTEGDRAVCISIESSKWIEAGFAVEKP